MLLLTRREDPDTLFFSRRLVSEGNTELGLTVKNLLDALDPETVLNRLPLPLARAAPDGGGDAAWFALQTDSKLQTGCA